MQMQDNILVLMIHQNYIIQQFRNVSGYVVNWAKLLRY